MIDKKRINTTPTTYLLSELKSSLEIIGPIYAAWILARKNLFCETAYFRITEHWSLCCLRPGDEVLGGQPPGVVSLVLFGHYKTTNLPDGAEFNAMRLLIENENVNETGYAWNSKTPFFGDDIAQSKMDANRCSQPKVYLDAFAASCVKMIGYLTDNSTISRVNNFSPWHHSDKNDAAQGLGDVKLCLETLLDILDSSPFQGAECVYDIPRDCFVNPISVDRNEETGWLKKSAKVGEATLIDDDCHESQEDSTEQVASILFDLFTKSWSDRDLMGRFAADPRAVLVEHGIKIKAVLDADLSRLIRNIAYGLDSTGAKRECLRSEEDRMLIEAANKQMGFVENVNESSDSEFLNECKDLAARLEI